MSITEVFPLIRKKRYASRIKFVQDKYTRRRLDFDVFDLCNNAPKADVYKENKIILNSERINNFLTYNRFSLDGPNENSDKLHILGKGGFGTIFSAVYKNKEVAVKVMKLSRSNSHRVGFDREKNALKLTSNHPCIIKTYEIKTGIKYGIIITDLLSGITLQTLMHYRLLRTLKQAISYILQICDGINFCHQNGILHLDIKPSNVLIDYNGLIKLCDFGNSYDMNSTESYNKVLGTIIYMAPELINCSYEIVEPTVKCDVYSIGITMWQLENLKIPYDAIKDNKILIQMILKERKRPDLPALSLYSNFDLLELHCLKIYQRLYQACWKHFSSERPDIDYIQKVLSEVFEKL